MCLHKEEKAKGLYSPKDWDIWSLSEGENLPKRKKRNKTYILKRKKWHENKTRGGKTSFRRGTGVKNRNSPRSRQILGNRTLELKERNIRHDSAYQLGVEKRPQWEPGRKQLSKRTGFSKTEAHVEGGGGDSN